MSDNQLFRQLDINFPPQFLDYQQNTTNYSQNIKMNNTQKLLLDIDRDLLAFRKQSSADFEILMSMFRKRKEANQKFIDQAIMRIATYKRQKLQQKVAVFQEDEYQIKSENIQTYRPKRQSQKQKKQNQEYFNILKQNLDLLQVQLIKKEQHENNKIKANNTQKSKSVVKNSNVNIKIKQNKSLLKQSFQPPKSKLKSNSSLGKNLQNQIGIKKFQLEEKLEQQPNKVLTRYQHSRNLTGQAPKITQKKSLVKKSRVNRK